MNWLTGEPDTKGLWYFEPQPDITAYELAWILSRYIRPDRIKDGKYWTPPFDGAPAGHVGKSAERHFVKGQS